MSKIVLNKLDFNIPFYFRYVNEIILLAPIDQISNIVECFNSFHNRLQFIVEYKNDRKLSFMDFLLEVVDNVISIGWFHKETFSGRFLSYYSNHPQCHKIHI